MAAAAALILSGCGNSDQSGDSTVAPTDSSTSANSSTSALRSSTAVARYSNEATARYLSHLDHPLLEARRDEELIKWGRITCDEAYAEGYTPRHTIRDEGGFSDGESLLVSMAAVIELCPDSMTDFSESEFREFETFFQDVKDMDSETLDSFGR
ncbi:DUF732 domain-containing protein [Rhodococcus sp. (in: high G+C Gram-positive bacteria)]|uniref:DUF732 domain-containing protein n=1 Tax=Rhodococcus sp. TaxID=1831 RepID=UPI0025847552|nr:DUF732 domain-containing protein [Rhodococcus sp. (in: high G+C Gram-positive bacteria)]